MGGRARKLADVVIVTDDNPRSEDPAAIRRAILEAVPEAKEIGDRREAIRAAVAMLRAGDTLIVAGKGHEIGQEIAGQKYPFSDHQEVRQALREMGAGRFCGRWGRWLKRLAAAPSEPCRKACPEFPSTAGP